MRRVEVIRRIRTAAKARGVSVDVVEGANHTLVRVGSVRTTIARHNEIAEQMAAVIFRQVESELGKGWWRR